MMSSGNSFGSLLRLYRHRCSDPETGRRLSQERLGSLIGEKLGTPYTAQAVSDWERDQSQIHKDHRQVLVALIQILHEMGGINHPEDAERLLAVGNYRGLTIAEQSQVFGSSIQSVKGKFQPSWFEKGLIAFGDKIQRLTPLAYFKTITLILSWLATWLGISPAMNINSQEQELLPAVVIFGLTSLIIPTGIAWSTPKGKKPRAAKPLALWVLQNIGSSIGYMLGNLSILALALISYHLLLYPWPRLIVLLLAIWPVLLSCTSVRLVPQNYLSSYGRIQFQDFKGMLITFLLPFLTAWTIYTFHTLLLSKVFGPLVLILGMSGVGVVLYVQTRQNP
ncbi:helix-turn-helix domain-containing protein [bacterium]|nr:helix-turn-helix domain-containing protein [bacterium]